MVNAATASRNRIAAGFFVIVPPNALLSAQRPAHNPRRTNARMMPQNLAADGFMRVLDRSSIDAFDLLKFVGTKARQSENREDRVSFSVDVPLDVVSEPLGELFLERAILACGLGVPSQVIANGQVVAEREAIGGAEVQVVRR